MPGSVVWKKFWNANPVISNVEVSNVSENVSVTVSVTKLNSIKLLNVGCITSAV